MSDTVTVAGVFGIFLAAWVAHRLAIDRDRIKAFRDACAKFQSAFADAKAGLSDGKIDAHAIMSKFRAQHDAAIIEFRRSVVCWKRKRFDATCETFRQCRERIEPALLEFYKAQTTGMLRDRSNIQELYGAIDDLLAFADKA